MGFLAEMFCLDCERALRVSEFQTGCPECDGSRLRTVETMDLDRTMVHRLLEEARMFLDDGDHEPAVDTADRVLALDPGHREGWTIKARGLEGLGDMEIAVSCYRTLADLTDDDPDVLVSWGEGYLRMGRPAQALQLFERVLRMRRGHTRALGGRARALTMSGREQEALDELNLALNASPEDAALWLLKGSLLEERGRHANALRCYDQALDILPEGERGEAVTGRDRCLRVLGKAG
jgi:tetratricopeptide (TPR) repeat protein